MVPHTQHLQILRRWVIIATGVTALAGCAVQGVYPGSYYPLAYPGPYFNYGYPDGAIGSGGFWTGGGYCHGRYWHRDWAEPHSVGGHWHPDFAGHTAHAPGWHPNAAIAHRAGGDVWHH